MPFTPTHILAIVPIATVSRGVLPFSALVVGSMVPDFPLFSPVSPTYETTHSAWGLFTACLPLGLAADLLFQSVMKQPLLALLPRTVQRRCTSLARPALAPTPTGLLRVSLAIVAGAATHLLWDSFTHRGRWGTQLLPALNQTALTLGGQAIPGFKLVQYGSTAIGLPFLLLVLAIWLCRQEPAASVDMPRLPARTKIAVTLMIVAVPACVSALTWRQNELSRYERLGQSITASGLVLMLASVTYCGAFHAITRLRR